MNAVRRLLGEGNSTINEGTDDGESLLSLACSAGYYELAQVYVLKFGFYGSRNNISFSDNKIGAVGNVSSSGGSWSKE